MKQVITSGPQVIPYNHMETHCVEPELKQLLNNYYIILKQKIEILVQQGFEDFMFQKIVEKQIPNIANQCGLSIEEFSCDIHKDDLIIIDVNLIPKIDGRKFYLRFEFSELVG